VTDNDAGELIATVTVNDKSDGKITFANDYHLTEIDRELVLTGTKKLTGRDLVAGEFAFGLYDEKGALIETVTNDVSGVFTFSKLSFRGSENETANYTYTIKEISGSDSSITYDKAVYTVVVTLMDNGQGCVELSYTVNGVENGKLVFNNVYTELETPETGDEFPVMLMVALMLMSATGLALVLVLLKRRKSGKWAA
jgi:pilin isopeptide linkage protein/LPXTG-motif cell wall-anchored protein